MGVVPGVPDIIIIQGGRTYGLELKSMGGAVRPSQRLCHAAMQEAGANINNPQAFEKIFPPERITILKDVSHLDIVDSPTAIKEIQKLLNPRSM